MFVKEANKNFINGKYKDALNLYVKASNLIGYNFFKVNIELCHKKLKKKESNDVKLKIKIPIKLLSILDEISELSWGNELKIFPLVRKNYAEQIITSNSIGLFLESCWKGNKGAWEYAFTSPNLNHNNAKSLCDAIDVAKARGLPVIFWNKEDPMHYEKFLPIASKADIIFTTDENKIKAYKKDLNNYKHVEVMPFAANPKICNPENRFSNKMESICFAGSYYSEAHEERKVQMDKILPSIIFNNGVIYDRMSKLKNKRYAYPSEYTKHIRDAVPFSEIVNVYKKFNFFLNVNTIVDSPTMMSRRVYELLACGTPVISTPSDALDNHFPGIVQIATNANEANRIISDLSNDEWSWMKISHLGYREVMKKHTYRNRTDLIIRSLGYDSNLNTVPLVSIIIATNRTGYIDRMVENISCQIHPNIEIFITVQNYSIDEENLLRAKLNDCIGLVGKYFIIKDESDTSLGFRLNRMGAMASGEYIAKMDDDDFYFKNYIADMIIPFSFSNCGIVGKEELFVYLEATDETIIRYAGKRHKITDFVAGASLVLKKEIFNKLKFGDKNRGEDSSLLEQAKILGIKIYASDPFNLLVYRSKDVKHHTWQVQDSFFKEKGVIFGKGKMLNSINI